MKKIRKKLIESVILVILFLFPLDVMAANEDQLEQAIVKWVQEFQPSALTPEEQAAELKWFNEVSKPLRGLKLKSVAEKIGTHYWERDVLAKAFEDITGIQVDHEIIHEGRK